MGAASPTDVRKNKRRTLHIENPVILRLQPLTVTVLQCDASKEGLGAWVRLIDSNNHERIIAMASRSLTDAEKRYSNIERECLAVMYGLEKFEYYLLGRQTLVETERSPLEQIFKKNSTAAPTGSPALGAIHD